LKKRVYKIFLRKIYEFPHLKKGATTIDNKNPKTPIMRIPIAETFEIVSNSFFVGFFKITHTLLHCEKKVFSDVKV
jgi:hypothetical protein